MGGPLNKSDLQRVPKSATPAHDRTPSSKRGAMASTVLKLGSQSGAVPSDHVCADACTHEGATKGKSTSPSAPGTVKAVPPAAKGGNESTARRS